MLQVKSSPSTSLPDKLVEPDPSSSKDTSETLARTGASFTAAIVKVTVASDVNSPSDTLNVKLSLPLKFASGVQVANEPSKLTLPLDAELALKVKLSPSISDPDNVITTLSSSDVSAEEALATGASLTALTVTVIV